MNELKYGDFVLKYGQYYIAILFTFNKRCLDVYWMLIIFLSDNKYH